MASREKILISLTVVAVLWGVIDWITRSGAKNTADAETAGGVANVLTNDLQRLRASLPNSNVVAYLETAGEPAAANPFADADLSPGSTRSTTGATEFVYSGYIQAGSRAVAIINGQEYGEGDLLLTGDHFVERILKDKVLLRSKEKGDTNEVFLIETTTE